MLRTCTRAALILLGLLLLYPLAAYASWLVPYNAQRTPPATGIRIVVMSNGVHTGIAMPVVSPLWDWRARLGLRAKPGAWVWLGWGERSVYLETPRWADVRVGTLLAAALGSDRTLVHADILWPPARGPDARAILLGPADYRRLAEAIDASFAPAARPIPGYAADDRFYAAHGRYSALHTCNDWTGEMLRAGGVRIGRWTPTAGSVLVGL